MWSPEEGFDFNDSSFFDDYVYAADYLLYGKLSKSSPVMHPF